MKKYLVLAALLLAGNICVAEEAASNVATGQEEVVITEKDMQEAVAAAQEAVKVLVEEMAEAAKEAENATK